MYFSDISPRVRIIGAALVAVAIVAVLILIFTSGSSSPTTSASTPTSANNQCLTSNVTVERAGPPSTAAGATYESISVTNRKSTQCALPATITARAFDSATNSPVGLAASVRGTSGAVVELPGNGEAILQFGVSSISSVAGCTPKRADDVQFSLDGSSWITVANPVTACTNVANLTVTPFSVLAPVTTTTK
jgi:hypothetical protein